MVVWHVTTKIMLVVSYLLEDEQELSLGMLIRPKRIYNFCLHHACFCWNYALEAITHCSIIIPGSLLMFICLCYNCNGLCGGLPSSMLTASGGKPICRSGI